MTGVVTVLAVLACSVPSHAQLFKMKTTDQSVKTVAPAGTERIRMTDTLFVPEGYELVDSVVFRIGTVLDTTLLGKDIFELLSRKDQDGRTQVTQSYEIADAFANYVRSNKDRALTGYRVRIFFDNKRTARAESERILSEFRNMHHDVQAYRSYANPYFKVTVGDFRTRSEAKAFLTKIRKNFPSAFIVKEPINYPVLDRNRPVIEDTVRVLRLIQPVEQE